MNRPADQYPFDQFPSLEPIDETIAEDDPAFISACLAHFAEAAESGAWRLAKSVLTQSDKWGLVWRADFQTPSETATSGCKRVMCWRPPGEEGVCGAFFGSIPASERLK